MDGLRGVRLQLVIALAASRWFMRFTTTYPGFSGDRSPPMTRRCWLTYTQFTCYMVIVIASLSLGLSNSAPNTYELNACNNHTIAVSSQETTT
ncbi:Abhydrolase domain-containing protein [Fusarium oxysporum f. sp. albedinis]|nr:Abhydrolase domain-containing protein [Fusarium oxysporum f. sp. albedinis]